MVKRIILAVILLAVVGTVSYIKSVRGTSGAAETRSGGSHIGTVGLVLDDTAQLVDYQSTIDSLQRMLDQRDATLADSLQATRIAWGRTVDSLFEKLDSLDCLVDRLYLAQAADSGLKDSSGNRSEVDSSALAAAQTRRTEIIEHYRQLYEDLPDDLSAYERRVALYEIRLQTARHFDISLGSLKEMRSERGLSY